MNASRGHLDEVARQVGIRNPTDLARNDLVAAIEKANARATAHARRKR